MFCILGKNPHKIVSTVIVFFLLSGTKQFSLKLSHDVLNYPRPPFPGKSCHRTLAVPLVANGRTTLPQVTYLIKGWAISKIYSLIQQSPYFKKSCALNSNNCLICASHFPPLTNILRPHLYRTSKQASMINAN